VLDDLEQLVEPVSLLAREADELSRTGDDRSALRRAGDSDPATAAELEQALVAQDAQRAQSGVGVDSEDGGQVAGRGQSLAGLSLPVGDCPADLGRDLLVQLGRFVPVDPDGDHGAIKSSVIVPPVLEPPRLAEPDRGEGAALDPEALIEEARRRARRRRAAYVGAALLAIGAGLGVFFASGGGGPRTPRHSEAGPPNKGLPQVGTTEGTVRVSVRDTVLFAARGRSLFALVVPPGHAASVTVMRVDHTGAATRNRVSFDLPGGGYLADVSAGPDGIYAGTAVIRRFTQAPDKLVRIDPRTLTIRARASFPASVATVEQGSRMWAAIGDGRVVRLDPSTLAIEASRRVLSAAATASGAAVLSKPAFGLGSVWVLAGNVTNLELVRMEPTSLAVRSRTRVPTGGDLAQALNHVAADASHVYLVGGALAAVGADGKLLGRPVLVGGLANAAIHGTGLIGLTAEAPALVLLDPDGRIRARTTFADAGADLAVSGQDAWFLGDAGRGNGIVHVQVATR